MLQEETDSPFNFVSYALALKAQERFSGVQITQVDKALAVPAGEAKMAAIFLMAT